MNHSKEEMFEKLMALISKGHEAVINHEEVDEYKAEVRAFLDLHLENYKKELVERVEEYRECIFESDGDLHTCYSCASGKLENCKKCHRDRCTNVLCPKGVRQNQEESEGINYMVDTFITLITGK
jgi:uncharacterized protein YlzI (FlbEa/FlbD family)